MKAICSCSSSRNRLLVSDFVRVQQPVMAITAARINVTLEESEIFVVFSKDILSVEKPLVWGSWAHDQSRRVVPNWCSTWPVLVAKQC